MIFGSKNILERLSLITTLFRKLLSTQELSKKSILLNYVSKNNLYSKCFVQVMINFDTLAESDEMELFDGVKLGRKSENQGPIFQNFFP